MTTLRTFLTLLLITAIVPTCMAEAPFGHLKDIEANRDNFLINKLAENGTIKYCTYVAQEDTQYITEEELDTQIKDSFSAFTKGITKQIKKDKRAEEFQDIIAMLEKPVKLSKYPQCNLKDFYAYGRQYFIGYQEPPIYFQNRIPDITFIANRELCKEMLEGKQSSFFSESPIPFICINSFEVNTSRLNKESIPIIGPDDKPICISDNKTLYYKDNGTRNSILSIMHEIGHALTLADQYEEGLDNNDILYSTIDPGTGLMSCSSPISCDDIDGLITALDRATNTQRTFKSFCPNNNIFENGKQILTGERTKTIIRKDNIYHNGKTIYTLNEKTKDNLVYREYSLDSYTLNESTKATLEAELVGDLSKVNIEGQKYFTIEKTGTLQDNLKMGRWMEIIKVGNQTVIRKTTFNKGKLTDLTSEVYTNDPKKDDLKSNLDKDGKIILKYSFER